MNDKKYYDNIREVKNIISMLDNGAIGLDEAKKLYEQGIALIEECKSTLNGYQGRVEDLSLSAASVWPGWLMMDRLTSSTVHITCTYLISTNLYWTSYFIKLPLTYLFRGYHTLVALILMQ